MSCNQPKSPKLNTLSNTKQEAVAIINNKKSKMGNKLMHDGERTKNDETDNKPGKGGVEPHYRTKAQAISNDEEIAARERSHVSCSPASLNPGNNGQRNKISEEAKQKRILLDLNQEVQLQVDGYGIFSNPVEDKGPHIDYYDVVDREQEAMDFGTMGKLIKDGNIATINDFERYLRRIVNSTRKYNSDKNSFTRLQADQIELRAHPIVNVAREKWSTLTSEVRQEDFTGNIDEDRSTKDSMINNSLSYAIDSDSDTSSHDYGNTSDSAESQDDFNDREVSTRTLRSFSPDIKTSSLENTTSEENKLSREKRSRIRNALMDKDENITIPRRVRIPRKVKSLSQKKQGSTRNKDSCAMERRKEGNRAQPTRYPIRSNTKRKAPGHLPIENSPSFKSSSETENTDNDKEIHSYSRSRRKQNNNEDDIHKRRTKRSRYTQVARKKQSKYIDKGSSDENSDNRDTRTSKENHKVRRKKSSRLRSRKKPSYKEDSTEICDDRVANDDSSPVSTNDKAISNDENVENLSEYSDENSTTEAEDDDKGGTVSYVWVRRRKQVNYTGVDDNVSNGNNRTENDKRELVSSSNFPFVDANTPSCRGDLSSSVMEPYSSREEWLRLCPELLMVCNEAARRAALRGNVNARMYDKPLSEIYIKERLEYDNPLNGLIIRSKESPHALQGFIVTTNFTIWRNTFRWTMDSPAALITPRDHRMNVTDKDGTLTAELQNVQRKGTDSRNGFTFHRVCEIVLLGGLGCGGTLVSRTLATLRNSGKYDYVVLQSTKMAIPFYEKHGFVRVGAVTRLNDNVLNSEVAYRHWSEIVDGQAVEPSYMMALRFESLCLGNPQQTVCHLNDISLNDRRHDIISSLKSTYSLLLEAVSSRATGSTSYSNSYRELLLTAIEFAKSADDYNMYRTIYRSLSEFTGDQLKDSKLIIRNALGPKAKGRQCVNLDENVGVSSITSIMEMSAINVEQLMIQKDMKVTIIFGGSEEDSEDKYHLLQASLPNSWMLQRMSLNSRCLQTPKSRKEISVRVVLGQRKPSKSKNSCLKAVLPMTPSQHIPKLEECEKLAMDNLWTFMPLNQGGKEDKPPVQGGDIIMLRVRSRDGLPIWVEALVESFSQVRNEKKTSYIIKWKDETGPIFAARLLGQENRGVGREWCTLIDWFSFTVLPVTILDALLYDSWVDYQTNHGDQTFGHILKRVGKRLTPKWRLKKTKKHISIGLVREAVDISNENYADAAELLELYLKKKNTFSKGYNENPLVNSAHLWAENRLREESLLSLTAAKRAKNNSLMNKRDDGIIQYPTVSKVHDGKEKNDCSIMKLNETSKGRRGRRRKIETIPKKITGLIDECGLLSTLNASKQENKKKMGENNLDKGRPKRNRSKPPYFISENGEEGKGDNSKEVADNT